MANKGESSKEEENVKGIADVLSNMPKVHERNAPPKQRCHNPLRESDFRVEIDLNRNLLPPIPELRYHISDSCIPREKVLNKNEAHGRPMIFKRNVFEDDGVLEFLARNQWNINQGIQVRVFDRHGTEYENMTLMNRAAAHRPQYVLSGENWKAFCNANDFKNEVGNMIGIWLFTVTEKSKPGLCLAIMIASRKKKHETAITNRSYFDGPLNKRRREDDDDDQGGSSSKKQSGYPTRSSEVCGH